MLESLHVKNLALIEETEINFGTGLNILTGETGAGKSIIIGSVNLALGARADKEFIRSGAEYASVEAVFSTHSPGLTERLRELEIPEEDGMLILSRRIMPTRSVCKVNGEVVSMKQLAEISQYIIDIYGQHEHQSLLSERKQAALLDEYAGKKLSNVLPALGEAYRDYMGLKKRAQEELSDDTKKEKELDLAQFEFAEIENAGLTPGEDADLEENYQRMLHGKKIQEALSEAYVITGEENGQGVSEEIGRALRLVNSVVSFDSRLEPIASALTDVEGMMGDFNRELSEYMEDMEFSQEEFLTTRDRLDLVNHLKSKYGQTVEQILDYQAVLNEKIKKYLDYDAYKAKLIKEMDTAREHLLTLCEKAYDIRRGCAKELSRKMEQALKDLNFLDVNFKIEVKVREDYFSARGYDSVTFLISTNPGEPLKNLGSVASGGELSRIMLALKTVLASEDDIDTFIFDEIDTGISGKTAWKVSEKLGLLGRRHQVICITHLPQIAAMADTHFLIEKSVKKNSTSTHIQKLESKESIAELARLLGGEQITEAVLNNAREMKELAADRK